MDREARIKIADDTINIIQAGEYRVDDRIVDIRSELAQCRELSKIYAPEDFAKITLPQSGTEFEPEISVTNETTLEAAQRVAGTGLHTCCLNFASAKHPGGGFLKGAQAQEECLARASGLYHSLTKFPEMYEYNKRLNTSLYSNYLIFSPHVPVFKDDDGNLLAQPFTVSFITSPAVNAGAVKQNEPRNVAQIYPVMQQRARTIFLVAAEQRCEILILGAWGCGVFENDPDDIAGIFKEICADKSLMRSFRQIIFAVYDRTAEQANLRAFKKVF